VDTSGLFALLDAGDENHALAREAWQSLVQADEPLATTSYVLVETAALVQDRLGLQATKILLTQMIPEIAVAWVDATLHETALASLLVANRRDLSLVDCASFEVMRKHGVTRAFTFDRHFRQQGFECVP